MNKHTARCPQCQSIFFISAAQSKVANNQVQCGRCGNLFNTIEHEYIPPTDDDGDNTFFLGSIEPTPEKYSASHLRFIPIIFILCLGLSGLSIQYTFFNAASLSQKIEYRPWIQQFCYFLNCDVPSYTNRELILAERLIVRANPDIPGSLSIEFILTNTAAFEQPYPELALRFNDQDQHSVAARQFSPREYLPRSISVGSPMPTDKSVRIKMAILDPGQTAVSYVISVTK